MNKKIILILSLVLVALGGILVFKNKNKDDGSLAYLLNKHNATIEGIIDFSVTQRFENKFFAENEGEIIKVKILNDLGTKEAEEYTTSQTVMLRGLFEPQLPPYPEFLTQQNACGNQYLPVKKESQFGDFYVLFANNRFGYGVCSDDLIKYRAGKGFFYCQSKKTVIELEYFIDVGESSNKIEKLMNSFRCG